MAERICPRCGAEGKRFYDGQAYCVDCHNTLQVKPGGSQVARRRSTPPTMLGYALTPRSRGARRQNGAHSTGRRIRFGRHQPRTY
jgi:hypothetical protein